jgi:hypothetical protein
MTSEFQLRGVGFPGDLEEVVLNFFLPGLDKGNKLIDNFYRQEIFGSIFDMGLEFIDCDFFAFFILRVTHPVFQCKANRGLWEEKNRCFFYFFSL